MTTYETKDKEEVLRILEKIKLDVMREQFAGILHIADVNKGNCRTLTVGIGPFETLNCTREVLKSQAHVMDISLRAAANLVTKVNEK